MKPIRLLWLVLAGALIWSAYWGWTAWSSKAGLQDWQQSRRADGWQVEWRDLDVTGFPNRIDTTFHDVILANPEGGWVWTAPFFQVLRLSYDPNKLVLVWPDQMSLQTPYERVAITGAEMRGSAALLPGGAREVESTTLVFNDLTLVSDAGWTVAAQEARLAMRPNAQDATRKDVGLDISGLKPRSKAMEQIAELGLAAPVVETLRADLTIGFDAPWDRDALEGSRPQPTHIDVNEIAVAWGRLTLRIAGTLDVDAAGRMSGDVLVKATNWEDILDLARQSGTLPAPVVDTAETALRLLSRLAGSPRTLDIALSLEDGHIRAGPVPLGQAPRVRIP